MSSEPPKSSTSSPTTDVDISGNNAGAGAKQGKSGESTIKGEADAPRAQDGGRRSDDDEVDGKTEEEPGHSSSDEEGEINEAIKQREGGIEKNDKLKLDSNEVDTESDIAKGTGDECSEGNEDEVEVEEDHKEEDTDDDDDDDDDDDEQADHGKEDEDVENTEAETDQEMPNSGTDETTTDHDGGKRDHGKFSNEKKFDGSQNEPSTAKEHPAVVPAVSVVRESFLSYSLTEEERRTRTRYIPPVDGMHALNKQEIKSDLYLARTLPGTSTSTKGKTKHQPSSQRESPSDDVTMDDTENNEMNEQLPSKDSTRSLQLDDEQRRIQIGPNTELIVPSTVFRAPPPVDFDSDRMDAKGELGRTKRPLPREVDSITAFNPPRLPESVAAKKKHRMLRWQRRPADMDVDLHIYQKTVQRTREELRNAEAEYQRILTIDNRLRHHFLQHIKCLNEEMALVNQELAAEQHKCLKATEWYLPTSRTRSRNDGKTGSKAMKDIIHGLRRLDVELQNKRHLLNLNSEEKQEQNPGMGGVSGASFIEWHRSTKIKPCNLASSWILPNDKVVVPKLGGIEGTAIRCFPYTLLDVNENPLPEISPRKRMPQSEDAMELDSPLVGLKAGLQTANSPNLPKFSFRKKTKFPTKFEEEKTPWSRMLAPRVAVRFPFGVGFFSVDAVKSNEDVSIYTNERLAERWKEMIETASLVAPTLDIGSMMNKTASEVSAAIQEYEKSLASETLREPMRTEDSSVSTTERQRIVPFGAGMLPSAVARGALLEKASMVELSKGADKLVYGLSGVLGTPGNDGITPEVRDIEDKNQEYINLQAKVLQLRNQLYRQRRIRILNEKTYNATKDRASRVESLVSEMRTDLKTLKVRLDEEIRELGISEETAENILTSFYSSLDVQSSNEPPARRPRRTAQMEEDEAVVDVDVNASQ